MTINEVLQDIKSDRRKKIILDCDAGNEIDDQYAIAYALACDKLEVLSINATQFLNTALVPTREAGMIESYNEIKRVLKLVGREEVPVYYGCPDRVGSPDHNLPKPDVIPLDCEAVQNIIKTAKESDETVYVVATGAASNVASAIRTDPSIIDNICVLWVATNCIETGGADEYNLGQDLTAGRYLINCGVNLLIAPAIGPEGYGTQVLRCGRAAHFEAFPGEDAASRYFREELPLEHDGEFDEHPDTWFHIYWDAAGPAILNCPDTAELEIIPAPRVRGDSTWSIGEDGRHDIIYMKHIDPAAVIPEMFEKIGSLIK